MERYRQLWGARLDALGQVVEDVARGEQVDGRDH